jgi:UDP-N-acetylglucosamine 2-epimerase (non-hydrolysing)
VSENPPVIDGIKRNIVDDERFVLITGHRRENFGCGFEEICNAILALSSRFPEVHFIYPVHLNPNVQEPVNRILGKAKFNNIHLIKPLSYIPFVHLVNKCELILTDSGGIQEEGPSLGKPVLVMRDVTKRPEGVDAGTVKLVGTNTQLIIKYVSKLLMHDELYDQMISVENPYGDGTSSQKIASIITSLNSSNV